MVTNMVAPCKSDPVSLDTELSRMTVTKEADAEGWTQDFQSRVRSFSASAQVPSPDNSAARRQDFRVT